MNKDFYKYFSIRELDRMFSSEKVARGLIDKVSLYAQAPRRRTEAEKRRALQLGRITVMLARDSKL